MRVRSKGELDRQSLPIYPGATGGRAGRDAFYVSMLEHDVSSALVPIGGRVRGTGNPCARLESGGAEASPELEELVALGISGDRNRIESAVAEWVNQTGMTLIEYGRAAYEIAYIRERAAAVGFSLVFLNPVFVHQRGGAVIQRVPGEAVIIGDALEPLPSPGGDRKLVLDPARILLVEWPREYGHGPRWVQQLRRLGRSHLTGFVIKNLEVPESRRVPYDLERIKEVENRALASVTKRIGWNARGLLNGVQTSPYYCLRELRLKAFEIVLRDHLVVRLNEAVRRAGVEVGFDAHIVLQGVATLSDVAEAEEVLLAGKVPCTEILERFRIYY